MASRQTRLRGELEAQAGRLRRQLSELARNAHPTGIGLRPVDGGDVVDQASASVNREQSRFRAAMLVQRLEQVTDALRRLDEGRYGQCQTCGDTISQDRLEVLPTTTLCVADQEHLEHGRAAPATLHVAGMAPAGQTGRRHG